MGNTERIEATMLVWVVKGKEQRSSLGCSRRRRRWRAGETVVVWSSQVPPSRLVVLADTASTSSIDNQSDVDDGIEPPLCRLCYS